MRRIFSESRDLGLPEPKIEEIALRLRFTVYLAKHQQIKTQTTEQAGAKSGLESGLGSLADRIVRCLAISAMSKSEIAQALGHSSISGKLNTRVNELLDHGLIKRTLPRQTQ